MNKLAKEINKLLLDDPTLKEYLDLKNELENDNNLIDLRFKLDSLRKEICKNKEMDSSEYYNLLEKYKSDARIKRYEVLEKEVKEFLFDISDILSLK